MGYHVYHTEALVLDSRPFGEGDKLLTCYTRELGLVVAHAKSLREARSKLRYALTTFARAEIDLIHGKRGWKLISARPMDSHRSIVRDPERRRIFAEHARLLGRLIQGEEKNELLYQEVLSAIEFLRRGEDAEALASAELLFIVRVLAELGYWEGGDGLSLLTAEGAWTRADALSLVKEERSKVVRSVNAALRATQL